ncbi:hypothetical protein Q3G72_008536 [Acer saccharum]|nr:hypothetical protein Q3G72_008536 [Acer saccharum]
MAENEDLEQNQNVTENVNVPEVENQPENVNVAENVAETDNLAVVSYETQNDEHIQQTENVVQIEHASENKDLDQYLVYPRNTWAYDIIITVHCKLKFIVDIRRVLEEEGAGAVGSYKKIQPIRFCLGSSVLGNGGHPFDAEKIGQQVR